MFSAHDEAVGLWGPALRPRGSHTEVTWRARARRRRRGAPGTPGGVGQAPGAHSRKRPRVWLAACWLCSVLQQGRRKRANQTGRRDAKASGRNARARLEGSVGRRGDGFERAHVAGRPRRSAPDWKQGPAQAPVSPPGSETPPAPSRPRLLVCRPSRISGPTAVRWRPPSGSGPCLGHFSAGWPHQVTTHRASASPSVKWKGREGTAHTWCQR